MSKEKTNDWTYAPSLESTSILNLKKQYDHFVDGKFQAPSTGKYFPSINPSDQKEIAAFAEGSPEDIDQAVSAARKAFTSWSQLEGKDRGKYVFRIARILQERAKEFAVAESLDNGKPIRESKEVDIPLAANHFFYCAGWADKLEEAFPGTRPEPIGVAGQIIPWNFPLLMAAWKIAPALVTGNTVVLKPAETSPLTALLLAEVLQEAQLPPGVVNIVTGGKETGAALVEHPDVDKIAFTGSTAVGQWIQKTIAGSGKKLTLELGGKSVNIVFADAAIDQAVEGVVNGIFFNQGQVCCAGSRLIVEESVADTFIEKLKFRMESLIVGPALDKNTDIGAIHSQAQFEKIKSFLEYGKSEGIETYQPNCDLPAEGWFIRPTLFLNVAQSNRLNHEEIFGPVLTIQTFRTIDEAIQKANNSTYGLAAGVWSEKGSQIMRMTQELKAGVVWANTYNKFDPASPFGGYRASGFGREGGLHGLSPYLKLNQK